MVFKKETEIKGSNIRSQERSYDGFYLSDSCPKTPNLKEDFCAEIGGKKDQGVQN